MDWVRARPKHHTKWVAQLESWVTFWGLGRLEIDKVTCYDFRACSGALPARAPRPPVPRPGALRHGPPVESPGRESARPRAMPRRQPTGQLRPSISGMGPRQRPAPLYLAAGAPLPPPPGLGPRPLDPPSEAPGPLTSPAPLCAPGRVPAETALPNPPRRPIRFPQRVPLLRLPMTSKPTGYLPPRSDAGTWPALWLPLQAPGSTGSIDGEV